MPSIAIGVAFQGPNNETFKTTDFLGSGAFGEVYRAVGDVSAMVVAVKLLPMGILASDDSRVALLNEIRAAQQIRHPNVVQVLHVGDGSSSGIGPYVVMEYVPGGTLAQLLRAQGPSSVGLPLLRSCEMMIDLAQGARAINAKVIHRDIRPDNILIEGRRLKIGDFGISKFVDESTRLRTFKGGQHIEYMAPEGWQNQTNTFKLDVYSVGLVFYQILTLKHPLRDKVQDPGNFLDWEKAHLYHPCPDVRMWRKEVPLAIAQLLSRMVAKRPDDRPSWDEALEILSQPSPPSTTVHPSITAAVEAALARQQHEQKERLKETEEQTQRERQMGLYRYSCETLLEQLSPMVEQFNREFQHGQITLQQAHGFWTFSVPGGNTITITFFEPRETGIKVRGGEVIGGGWIGISNGKSANLVLLRQGRDDHYGRWVVCEIGIMAIADPARLIGKFGITRDTVVPFGFKDTYFYDQIQWAARGTHAFTYSFTDNVADFFASLLVEACGS